ncbi:MAG: extracellular solute-binding protein [Candidatus Rokuibacteriota bacterium]
MRRAWIGLVATVMALAIASAGWGAERTSLRIAVPEPWRIVKPLETNDRASVVPNRLWFYETVQSFRRQHPEITLRFEAVPFTAIESTFVTKAIAGDPPDISMMPSAPPLKLARAGYLAPLDEFPFPWQDFKAEYRRDSMSVDGKLYLMPGHVPVLVLFYNKVLFAKAGLTRPPGTWDELVQMAKMLMRDTTGSGKPDVWGFGVPVGTTSFFAVYPRLEALVWSAGGELHDRGRALIDTPAMRRAVKLYVDLVHTHKVMPETSTTWDQLEYFTDWFTSGKLGMTMASAEFYRYPAVDRMGEANVGIARLPLFSPGDPPATWVQTWGWVMSKQAAATKKEAAWSFLKQLGSEETYVLAAQYQRGLPPRTSLGGHPIYRSSPELEFQAKYVVEAGRPDPPIEEWQFYVDLMSRTVQAAVLRIRPVPDLLRDAQREYDARVKR